MKALRAHLGQLCACRARRAVDGGDVEQPGDSGASQSSDVELLAGTGSLRPPGSCSGNLAASGGSQDGRRSQSGGGLRCVNCRRNAGKGPTSFCSVAVRSIFDGAGGEPLCKHGPFCLRCRSRMDGLTLSTCVCRAVIASWRAGPGDTGHAGVPPRARNA
mmetsp:Transcript_81169/g.225914  ORF Transcript_81169/g.225914 Transcript_81169/m.225914 type:complete len:160 (+) Transcript_81169:164-643(+)